MNKEKVRMYSEQVRGVSYKESDIHDSLNDQSVTLLRANNIFDNELNFDNVVYIDKSRVSDKQYLRKGDIVVCASSGSKNLVGKAAQVDFDTEVTFGAFLKVVRPKNIIPKYLGYYFLSNEYRRTISSISEGANINNIRNEHIDDLLISIVDNDTQKMRSKILDKVYGILKRKKQQLTEYDQLIKSRFVEMFGDIFNGKSNYPTIKISEVVSPKIERAKKDFNEDDEIKYVDISSIDNKKNAIVGYTEYLMKDAPSRAQQHIRKDDILISTVRPNLNNVAKVPHDYSNIVASSGFCVLRASKVESDFLFALVSMQLFADYLASLTTGANYPAVSDKDILNFEIPNAPMEEQIKFSKLIKQVDKLKFEVQKSLNETQMLFDSLMQEYFG